MIRHVRSSNMTADSKLPKINKAEVDEIVEGYTETFTIPSLVSAVARKSCDDPSKILLTTEWKQRNLDRGNTTTIQRTFLCDKWFRKATNVNTVDNTGWVTSAYSSRGDYYAVIRTINDKENVSKNYLEVWNDERSLVTFDLTSLDLHGPVYDDGIQVLKSVSAQDRWNNVQVPRSQLILEHSGTPLSWSPGSDELVYIAEKTPAKTSPFYEQKSKRKAEEDATNLVGEKYVYDDDWGEQMSPKRQSVIAVCNIRTKSIRVVSGIPEDVCPGQVVWVPNGDGLVGVAFHHKPRRFGLVYCTNWRCEIFHLSSEGKYTVLSDDSKAAFSPRFDPNGKYLVWIQRDRTGPHFTISQLVKYDWATKQTEVVVDTIEKSVLTENGRKFYGIFTSALPHRCWSVDSKYIVFSSYHKYVIQPYAVDIESGLIWDIGHDNPVESVSILDIFDDNVLASCSSFNEPTVLVSFELRSAFQDKPFVRSYLTNYLVYDSHITKRFVVRHLETKEKICFATYFGPRASSDRKIPLILYPHGGPHSPVPSRFSPLFHLFGLSGFGVLIVGYRGTPGYGKKFIDALLGNVGQIDVYDCYASLQTALQLFPWLDKNRVILFGGSHGGFLVTHLSSQYPDDFISTVALNPVTNFPLMVYSTDIPEWNVVEAGHSYRQLADVIVDEELWQKMADVSPVSLIKNVKTPTLLLLGKKDLRVPASQGISYYNMLKELNVATKVFFYDDNHALSSVEVEMDAYINAIIWFKICLKMVRA